MLFHTPLFLLFLISVLMALAVARTSRSRRVVLLVASYLFYAHWDWRFLSLIALSTFVDFGVASRLGPAQAPFRRRAWLLVSLVTNLGLLAVFKYGNFLLAQIDAVTGLSLAATSVLPDEIPVGISFYTFQTLSYTIDVYRRQIEPCRSSLDFALYVAFFPQLVAGPIVRSRELIPQLHALPDPRIERIASGLPLFILGVFKKVVLADNASLFVDTVFGDPAGHSAPVLWAAGMAFAVQIYCDFSGYTDMAIGIGQMLGVSLPENFRSPYLSRSITEFWRRWHISLSTWLRDYLYIPLGGSRRGSGRTYLNLLATMLLGGLWHGASWTFVAWGGYHGALLAVERAVRLRESPKGALGAVRWLLTLLLVTVGWVAFRAEGFDQLAEYLAGMFLGWRRPDEGLATALGWVGCLLLLCLAERLDELWGLSTRLWPQLAAPAQAAILAIAVLLISYHRTSDVAFLYFQF